MHSTSVYGLELLVLEGPGEKALATDHRVCSSLFRGMSKAVQHCMDTGCYTVVFLKTQPTCAFKTMNKYFVWWATRIRLMG